MVEAGAGRIAQGERGRRQEASLDASRGRVRLGRSGPSPASSGRSPSAGDRCCTSPDQSDHKTSVRRVCYPWHPLYGKEVTVRGRKAGRRSVLRCQVDDDDKRDNREIPEWMFDEVFCSRIRSSSKPHASWEALADLRRLLDESGKTDAGETVEDRSPPAKEGTDARTRQTTNPQPAGRAVRSHQRSAKVAGHSLRRAKGGDRATCPDTESSPATGNNRPRGGA